MAVTGEDPPDLESIGGSVIAAAVTTVSIAAIFVGLRFVTRWAVVRALGLSDCAILLALVRKLFVISCFVSLGLSSRGLVLTTGYLYSCSPSRIP